MNIEHLLYDEIENEFEKLRDKTPGSDEHKAIVDEIVKLMDRAIEMEKVNNDCQDKTEVRENDQAMKKQQMEDEKRDRLIKNTISVAGIVLPLIVTIWGTKVSLKFEEEGTFTTIMGRGFINKLLPKK
jgi:hypothetical protein